MIYKNKKASKISFPLGGIGTGSIGLFGNGELNDWEIFNRPNKNSRNGYSHFAIKAKTKSKTLVKVLHGDTFENLMGTHQDGVHVGFGFGARNSSLAGFPHFKNTLFEGEMPFAKILFCDQDFPAKIKLCAFNPLIPQDHLNSSLPIAVFEWEIENLKDENVEYSIAFSVQNPAESSQNICLKTKNLSGVFMQAADKNIDQIGYNDLTVLTDGEDVSTQTYWYRGGWMDSITTFWNNFSNDDRLKDRVYEGAGKNDYCTVASYINLKPNEKKTLRFILSWNVPNQYNYWDEIYNNHKPCKDENGNYITWKNYYATKFANSQKTCEYAFDNYKYLKEKSQLFSKLLNNGSMPKPAIDAISANLSVLKSSAILRLEDGSFWGFEGVHENAGCCEGSCQHVYNYAYALPFLFPELERSMRENTKKFATDKDGRTEFRLHLPRDRKIDWFRPCVDGQMGEVIKVYREWKISGDDNFIKENANHVFSILEYAWSDKNPDRWDFNKDGILEGRQHHTLDVELFGANSWLQGFYLLALDCASKIAEFIDDKDRFSLYRSLYENGKKYLNEKLFNGEYFMQDIDLKNKDIISQFSDAEGFYWNEESKEIKYQIASGSIIDQVLADWHANLIGLPCVFDRDKKLKALESIYKYNFKPSMRSLTNMWRNFALNDEAGTVICAYPEGVIKPSIPIPYCEETMTGFEYAVGALMIKEGLKEKGEMVVKAVRDRYNGENRNPYNEIECGSNYARSMASYSLLLVYSGFSFDLSRKYIGFNPIETGDWSYLWSVGASWGRVKKKKEVLTFKVYGKPIELSNFGLPDNIKVASLNIDGKNLKCVQNKNLLSFEKVIIKKSLKIIVE